MKMPAWLPAACLNSYQNPSQKSEVMEAYNSNKIKLLFLSPERLFLENLDYSKVALVVIDEAHCASEWSHNFRPSFLRLQGLMGSLLKEKVVLALTATATAKTEESICEIFSVQKTIREKNISRNNICTTISRDPDKMKGLMLLLKGKRFKGLSSILVYCTYKSTTEQVARFLNVSNISGIS